MRKKPCVLTWIFLGMMLLVTCPVGAAYEDGEEAYLRGDFRSAWEFWKPLAEQGNSDAQNMLGYMYRFGEGVEPNYEQARKWYRLAADKGNPTAQNNLGVMYRLGLGGDQDFREAVYWFRRAADQGNGGAQNHLGLMYYKGEGVTLDKVHAYKWAYLAAQQGLDPALQAVSMLEQELTPAQIEEAKTMARKWKPRGEEVPL
ncbi:MAG: tetratricopeptide repeat protein [Nitrospirales bacterium]